MGELFIGHGGLVPENYSEGMSIVAIPPGTSLQFYTDAGQTLRIGRLEDAFAQLHAPWPPLTSENVTYNLTLSALTFDTAARRWAAASEGTSHTPHSPGWDLDDPIQLCNGTVDQCPTNPTQNRRHECTGILARFTGEMHWIACTNMVLTEDEEQVLDDTLQGRPWSAFLNSDPDSWDEHVTNLVTGMKRVLTACQSLGKPEDFVDHFVSAEYTDDERKRVVHADTEILGVLEMSGRGYSINSWD